MQQAIDQCLDTPLPNIPDNSKPVLNYQCKTRMLELSKANRNQIVGFVTLGLLIVASRFL